VKSFFDEDMAARVPEALIKVQVPDYKGIEYPRPSANSLIALGTKDPEWLPKIGDAGYMVISKNFHMLGNPAEFDLIVKHKVRVVYLVAGQELPWVQLRMVIQNWEWIRQQDAATGPQAWLLYPTGHVHVHDFAKGPLRLYPARLDRSAVRRPLPSDSDQG
jgi:hypothetical protein